MNLWNSLILIYEQHIFLEHHYHYKVYELMEDFIKKKIHGHEFSSRVLS